MAKTGPNKPGQSWQEANGTCNECGLSFGIGDMVADGKSKTITDDCPNPVCEGTATVTLKGD